MKLLCLFIGLIISTEAFSANSCRFPYSLGYSEKSWGHFYKKTDASNIWIKDFSSKKFINTYKDQVNFYEFTKSLIHKSDYNDVLDQNLKALSYRLFEKNHISQTEYQGLLQSLSAHSTRKEMIKNIIKNAKLDRSVSEGIERHLRNSKLNRTQLELFQKKLKDLDKNIAGQEKLLDYIDYLNTRKNREISSYIEKIDDLMSAKSRQVRNFNHSLKKIEKYKTRVTATLERKFQSQNKGKELNTIQRKRLAREIEAKTKTYSKTLRSCGNREFLSSHAKASEKKFTRFLIGFSSLTTVGGFSLANYEDPIDQEWIKKLSYEVVFGAFFSWLGAKVSINPHFSFMKKTVVNSGVSAGFDVFDSYLYDSIITREEDKASNLSERKKKEIEKLYKEFERMNLDKKFLKKYQEFFYVDQKEKSSELLYESELEKEDRYDEIIQAISENIEQGKMSDWLSENSGVKRFAFHRAWDIISIPKTVVLGVAMYKVFCMSKVSPGSAYRIAGSMIIADEVFESFLYYKVRKKTIDQ